MPRKFIDILVPASGGGVNVATIQKSIRFSKKGCANRPFYHIEVHTKTSKQHMQPIEQLGSYDPMPNAFNEKLVSLNYERIKYWIADGARVTKPVAQLLGLAGFFPIHPRTYMTAWRNRKSVLKEYKNSIKSEPEKKAQS